jgi:hypothetical protein
MSKIDERKMDCPSCKQEFSTKIYSSAHIDNPHDRAQIFNDKINVATCPHCDVGIQIDTPLLCANHKLKFAVWYDPNHDEQIDGAANLLDKAHWFQKSADQGYAAGQEGLATLYLFGNGVYKNIMESKRLLLLSANQGFVPAEGDLGILSMSDRDAPHNYVEAYFWLSLASMSGDADSAQEVSTQELKDIRDKAASMLTPQEISEVQNRVQSWRPLVR